MAAAGTAVDGVGAADGRRDGKLAGDLLGDLDGDGVPVGHGVDRVTSWRLDSMEADASSGGGSAARGGHVEFSSIDAGKQKRRSDSWPDPLAQGDLQSAQIDRRFGAAPPA